MPINLKTRESLNKAKAQELKKALKTDATGKPINFHWKEDQAKQFVDYIKDESNGLLGKFRVVTMDGPEKEIAKVLDDGKFLRPGGEYKRTGGTGRDGYQFGTDMLKLTSKKVEGLVYISDDELQDNIEGDAWENHVMQMCAKKIANENVEAIIYGSKVDNPSGENGILNMFDGIKYSILQGGNVIDASSLADRTIKRKTIIQGKKVLKTKYRNGVSVFMDSDIKTDFDELYNDPTGNRGDGETIKNTVSGMPIEEVPLMTSENAVPTADSTTTSGVADAGTDELTVTSDLTAKINVGDSIIVNYGLADQMTYTVRAITADKISLQENLVYDVASGSTISGATLDGADVIITDPKNIVVGIQLDITVEFERRAPDGWNIWYKMREDIVVENPEAAVIITNLKTEN